MWHLITGQCCGRRLGTSLLTHRKYLSSCLTASVRSTWRTTYKRDLRPVCGRWAKEASLSTRPIGYIAERSLSSLTKSNLNHDIEKKADVIFDLYHDPNTDTIPIHDLLECLHKCGIREDDPRLGSLIQQVGDIQRDDLISDADPSKTATRGIDRDSFKRCVRETGGIIAKSLKKHLAVPDWPTFVTAINELFESVRDNSDGKVADYIPQLARSDPACWGLSVCTVDGQRCSLGDCNQPFTLQSVSKPFTYAIAVEENGPQEVHKYIGQEPSGRLFNEICLDCNHKPHNPMVNAGAILTVSLLKRDCSQSDRFDFVLQQLQKFACNGFIGFNNAVFLSERETADRNYALSHYMREHKCFPDDTSLKDTLDLYFQLCSIEANTEALSVMAATLANGGVSPLNGQRVVCNRAVRNTLSLMFSCGMYDYSGQFAFAVGLPAKSGVSGDLMIVIPNVMGIALYSPALDHFGNSVRGVEFAEQLVEKFNFHNYDSLVYSESTKIDPRLRVRDMRKVSISNMMYAAKFGDISVIQKCLLNGVSIDERDYDDRTLLHVAAAEDNCTLLKFVLGRWHKDIDPKDRHGRTPLDEAKAFGHEKCVELLERAASSTTHAMVTDTVSRNDDEEHAEVVDEPTVGNTEDEVLTGMEEAQDSEDVLSASNLSTSQDNEALNLEDTSKKNIQITEESRRELSKKNRAHDEAPATNKDNRRIKH